MQQYRTALECECDGLPVKRQQVLSERGEQEAVPVSDLLLQTETCDETTDKKPAVKTEHCCWF